MAGSKIECRDFSFDKVADFVHKNNKGIKGRYPTAEDIKHHMVGYCAMLVECADQESTTVTYGGTMGYMVTGCKARFDGTWYFDAHVHHCLL